MSLEIYIARHGQNVDNQSGILNGRRDLPLTDIGRLRAKQLGQGISEAGIKIDKIYSSPLIRALETAKIVSTIVGLSEKPEIIYELIERDFGEMTGVHQSEINKRCAPDIIETDTVTYFLNPEGAETFPDLVARGKEALDKVRSEQDNGTALLVCHGDLGKMIYAGVTGKNWKDVLGEFHFGNGDLIEINADSQSHVIKIAQHNL